MLAALNHPAIGAIYGHADVDGGLALVLELVDGETLAERMVRPVSVAEALAIARPIAEALEAAHERGIVHRDLKPANIKITPDGLVKVLDFGLARIAAGESGEAVGSSASPASSPTATPHDTRAGAIVGTAAYMSPEQAAGKTADKRSDLWSFGVILLEMLTGHPVFTGSTDSDVLAAVQGTEPALTRLPADTPAAIRTLLRRCLEKDRKRRLDSATAARLEIEDVLREPHAEARAPAASRGRVARIVAATAAGLALGAVLGATITMWLMPDTPVAVSRFAIVTPPATPLNVASEYRDLALSPDGRYLVYRAAGTTTNGSALHVRALDEVDARPLAGITYAYAPFFSPDGRWVGFFENAELKKVSVAGGPVITVSPVIGSALGASWGDDNTIVFATDNPATGLWRVSADGGEPEVLTTPDRAQQERDHGFPSLLPGGRGVLFTILGAETSLAQVAVLDLDTRRRTTLVRGGGHGEYVHRRRGAGPAGHLIYAAAGTLRAIRFDPLALTVAGDSVEMVPRVMMKSSGAANYAVSPLGTLVYVPEGATSSTPVTSLVLVDRDGLEEAIAAPPRAYGPPRFSPDGAQIAVGVGDRGNVDVWILDVAAKTQRRLKWAPGMDGLPSWTPDGKRIVFMSDRTGALNWHSIAADGSAAVDRLTTSATPQWPVSIAPDGTRIFGFGLQNVIMGSLPDETHAGLSRSAEVEDLFEGGFPEISPDGRFLAYTSVESGRREVYVRPFPLVDSNRWQITSAGASRVAWARNGRELFYLDASNTLMVVPVRSAGPTVVIGSPSKVFDNKYAQPNPSRHYDVTPNGQRFLMLKERGADANATPANMLVVQNWAEEIDARVR
jgi:serine/threonine-protein kinase